jgi:hypothetical protein
MRFVFSWIRVVSLGSQKQVVFEGWLLDALTLTLLEPKVIL